MDKSTYSRQLRGSRGLSLKVKAAAATIAAFTYGVVSSLLGAITGQAYNEQPVGGGATHYTHCQDNGDHGRRPYTNYSEQTLDIYPYFPAPVFFAMEWGYLQAIDAWNATPTKLNIILGPPPQGDDWLTYLNDDNNLDGITWVHCDPGSEPREITWARVYGNWFYLQHDPQDVINAVLTHEMGHEIGLFHSIQATQKSEPLGLMWPSARQTGHSVPQTDDVCGVNAMYRSSSYPVGSGCHSFHDLLPIP